MIQSRLQSRFDKIEALVKSKGYAASDISLRGIGVVKRFPELSQSRFALQGSQAGDLVAYPGMLSTKDLRRGEDFLAYESAFRMGYPANLSAAGHSLAATQTSSLGAGLEFSSQVDVPTGSEILISNYTLKCLGTYPAGTRALTVESPLPVLRGDQWIVWGSQNGHPISHSTTVQDAFRTSNLDQWNVTVLDPIPLVVNSATNILVQASAAVQWDSVPLTKGPCWLTLPIATHIRDSNSPSVAYVRLKSSDRVIVDYFTFDPILTISLVPIPSQAWLASRVAGGVADFQAGIVRLVPTESSMSSRLVFEAPLEGDLMEHLKVSVKALLAGRLVFKCDSTEMAFQIQPGIQTLSIPIQGDLTFIEITNDVEISLGDISPRSVATAVDVTLHVFSAEGLASHVFQKPHLLGLFRDPSLTWAREGLSSCDAGFCTTPNQKLWFFEEGINIQPTNPALPLPAPVVEAPFIMIQAPGAIA